MAPAAATAYNSSPSRGQRGMAGSSSGPGVGSRSHHTHRRRRCEERWRGNPQPPPRVHRMTRPRHRRIGRAHMTLVIGDIHACYAELLDLLDAAGVGADEEILAVGDVLDRGPANAAALDFF